MNMEWLDIHQYGMILAVILVGLGVYFTIFPMKWERKKNRQHFRNIRGADETDGAYAPV